MRPQKVLFIDSAHPSLQKGLEEQGFQCDYFEDYGREQLKQIVSQYQGIIIRSKIKLDADFLEHAQKLQFIGRVGAGMENIDVDFARQRNISCLNAPEGNRDAVGEHALALLLMLFNKLKRADSQVRQGIWMRESNRGVELGGKTVGIIGYGNTGAALARKLRGFDTEVLAYDKYKTGFSDAYVKEASMDEIFEKCDVLSLHIPLSKETTYLVNKDYIQGFKKNIYLINTSRGRNVCTSDLVALLKTGKIKGACLDVLEYEGFSFEQLAGADLPQDFQELIQMEQVVLSPHIAGWTEESAIKMAATLVDKIKRLA